MVKKPARNTVLELKDVFCKGHGMRFIGADLEESRDSAIVEYVSLYRLYGKEFKLGPGVVVSINYGLCNTDQGMGYEIRFPVKFGDTDAGYMESIKIEKNWVRITTTKGVEYGWQFEAENDLKVYLDDLITNDME